MNRLLAGDNLQILRRHLADESVDLIYLDPPFNSNATYALASRNGRVRTRSIAQAAFSDIWEWDATAEAAFEEEVGRGGSLAGALQALRLLLGTADMLAYLVMMAPRLAEVRRVVRPTGSLYLHCDPTASHYLKVLLDAVFGRENYRNEIIWYYGGRGAKAIAHQFPRNHDVILLYSRQYRRHSYERQYVRRAHTPAEARARGLRQDESGRWFKTAPRGDYTDESLARLEGEGRIYRTARGAIRIKYFLEEENGQVVEDILVGDTWLDIPDAMHIGKERLGYPTQKPEALLRRIVLAGSKEGDTVLDPFCGSGTTLVAAQHLNRHWIGIDASPEAIALTRTRLQNTFGTDVKFESQTVQTLPADGP